MAKTIKLTVDDLRNIIVECLDSMFVSEGKGQKKSYKDIVEYNLYNRGIINEMALHKSEFIDLILNLKDQLVQNWCLCAYCSLYDKTNENYDHWCVEFASYANKIKRCNLKGGNKQNVIFNTYVDKYDLSDPNMVYRIIRGKFIKEQIDDSISKSLSEIFSQQIKTIVQFLTNDNYETEEYIMRTFTIEE